MCLTILRIFNVHVNSDFIDILLECVAADYGGLLQT